MRLLFVTVLAALLLLTACEMDSEVGNVPEDPIDVATLRERADDLDGETVIVRSNYWSDGQGQYLSDIMMESYPPQIPKDQAVMLDGPMPADVLAGLTHADPSYADVTWGQVEVTGRVRAGDELRLEIVEVRVIGTS